MLCKIGIKSENTKKIPDNILENPLNYLTVD